MVKTMLLTAAALPLIELGTSVICVDVRAQNPSAQAQIQTLAPAPSRITTSEYIQQAAMGDLFEIDASKLAVEKADSKDVKGFADKMVKDHSTLAKMLNEAIARSQAGVPAPGELDGEHKAKIAVLRNASGVEFDRLYVDMQVDAHQQALKLHTAYARTGDNEELKTAAATIAGHVEEHLEKIKEIQKSTAKKTRAPGDSRD